jgi:predicted nucleic acid-binding protein
MAVMDTSVYVAILNPNEPGHAASWAWYTRTTRASEPIVAPVILLAEAAAALSRGVGDAALAHRVVRQLLHSKAIELVPVTTVLAQQAAILAADQRLRGCDAIFVALAQQRADTLYTLDRQQLERGAAVVVTREPV